MDQLSLQYWLCRILDCENEFKHRNEAGKDVSSKPNFSKSEQDLSESFSVLFCVLYFIFSTFLCAVYVLLTLISTLPSFDFKVTVL